MPLRAVLWDFDDTLVPVHTLERWQWAWKPQGPRLNERHVRASIREGLRRWDRRRWQGLMGDSPPADAAAYREALREMLFAIADRSLPDVETEAVLTRFPKYPGPIEAYPDVRPCLEELKALGLRMAVVVGSDGSRARELLAQLRLTELLPQTFGEEPEGPHAPAAEAFESACSRLEVLPAEAAFVGDLFWSDIRAAGRVGLHGILLDRHDWWGRVESPRIHTLSELREKLIGLDAAPGEPAASTPPTSPKTDGPMG